MLQGLYNVTKVPLPFFYHCLLQQTMEESMKTRNHVNISTYHHGIIARKIYITLSYQISGIYIRKHLVYCFEYRRTLHPNIIQQLTDVFLDLVEQHPHLRICPAFD